MMLAGAAVISPAHAAGSVLTTTNYGFKGHAFGTRVSSDATGMSSARSAFTYIACTRIAGKTNRERLASILLPSATDPYVTVDSILDTTRTFTDKKRHIAAAMESSSKIGHVQLGSSSTPRLSFDGLETVSRAWATTGGKLKARNKFTSGTISLVNLPDSIPPELQGPLDDLQAALNGGINQVLQAIDDNGDTIVIPNLGELSLGFDKVRHGSRYASGSAIVLRVLLYGPDQAKGGADDSTVKIGTSWARINKDLPAGVMTGVGYGSKSELLNGALTLGKLGAQPLPCQGTRGEVLKAPAVGIDPPGAPFDTELVRGRAFGVQKSSGAARAWTEGTVADLKLGPSGELEIKGIVGRVNVRQDRTGRIIENSIKGSSIGEIIVNGESQGGFKPGDAKQIPADGIPGVAKIELFKRVKSSRGSSVSAVVITLLDNSPGISTVSLGNARAQIKRY